MSSVAAVLPGTRYLELYYPCVVCSLYFGLMSFTFYEVRLPNSLQMLINQLGFICCEKLLDDEFFPELFACAFLFLLC